MNQISLKAVVLIMFISFLLVGCTTTTTISRTKMAESNAIVGEKVLVIRQSGKAMPLIVTQISKQSISGQSASGSNTEIPASDVQSIEFKKIDVFKTTTGTIISTLAVIMAYSMAYGGIN